MHKTWPFPWRAATNNKSSGWLPCCTDTAPCMPKFSAQKSHYCTTLELTNRWNRQIMLFGHFLANKVCIILAYSSYRPYAIYKLLVQRNSQWNWLAQSLNLLIPSYAVLYPLGYDYRKHVELYSLIFKMIKIKH